MQKIGIYLDHNAPVQEALSHVAQKISEDYGAGLIWLDEVAIGHWTMYPSQDDQYTIIFDAGKPVNMYTMAGIVQDKADTFGEEDLYVTGTEL